MSSRCIKAYQRGRRKLSDVKTEAWAKTLADKVAEVNAKTIHETLTALKGTSVGQTVRPRHLSTNFLPR